MIYQKIGYFGKHKIVWKALLAANDAFSDPSRREGVVNKLT